MSPQPWNSTREGGLPEEGHGVSRWLLTGTPGRTGSVAMILRGFVARQGGLLLKEKLCSVSQQKLLSAAIFEEVPLDCAYSR